MMTNVPRTVELGDLVVAVFDEAAHYSTDPREVSRLATRAVMHVLRRAPKAWAAVSRQTDATPRRWQVRRTGKHPPSPTVPSIGPPGTLSRAGGI